MCEKSVLLAGFRNTSAHRMLNRYNGKKLICENDKAACAAQMEEAVKSGRYRYIFCFGQRPNIKDKVNIETQAKMTDRILHTDFDCEGLKTLFEQNNIQAKLSHNAGTSYCNHIYAQGLEANKSGDTGIVFIHIPFEKNISDFEWFYQGVLRVVLTFGKERNVPS